MRLAPFVPRSVAPEFPIEMIALDIDGTLVDDDLALADHTVAVIHRAVRRGIRVSLVTGRMTSSAIRFAESLGLSEPVVGYQGALIRKMPRGIGEVGTMLLHRPLAAGVARSVVTWARERGLDPHINHLERLVLRADDPQVDDYSAFLGTRATRAADLLAWIQRPVTKIVAVGPEGLPARLLGEARATFAGRADATVAHPRFLEFVTPGVNKGMAVRWLARRAGVPMGRVLAIGDQLNDLEMLATVGHGAAMPSGPDDLIRTARYIALPLAMTGSADMIERLALAGPREARHAAAEMADMAARVRAGL